jgi:regulatory protein
MAQSWQMKGQSPRRAPVPLTANKLRQLALAYVGRYATSSGKLATYLDRKLRERGWSDDGEPFVGDIVNRMVDLGYVDDRAFAEARTRQLQRRGYGSARVRLSLQRDGIAEQLQAEMVVMDEDGAFDVALSFARRRRLGPFANQVPDKLAREKAIAAMVRAGHSYQLAKRVIGLDHASIG